MKVDSPKEAESFPSIPVSAQPSVMLSLMGTGTVETPPTPQVLPKWLRPYS
jgi:hypothetical protein